MGIQEDEIIGFTIRAKELIRGAEERLLDYGITNTWSGSLLHPFSKYSLPDGRVLVEDVQSEPWSSGPCYFLALKDHKTGDWVEETLWSEEEMNEHL